jgi:hypothetical protein
VRGMVFLRSERGRLAATSSASRAQPSTGDVSVRQSVLSHTSASPQNCNRRLANVNVDSWRVPSTTSRVALTRAGKDTQMPRHVPPVRAWVRIQMRGWL